LVVESDQRSAVVDLIDPFVINQLGIIDSQIRLVLTSSGMLSTCAPSYRTYSPNWTVSYWVNRTPCYLQFQRICRSEFSQVVFFVKSGKLPFEITSIDPPLTNHGQKAMVYNHLILKGNLMR